MNMFIWLKKAFITSKEAPLTTAPANESAAQANNLLAESASCKNRGDVYLAEGKSKEADECYRQAISINPKNAEAFNNLGIMHLQQNLFEEAEQYLKQAILADPNLAKAYYFLGVASQKKGNLNTAIKNFNKALELKPDAEIIYRDLCYALFQSGQNEAAKEVIQRGLSVNPDFADFHSFLGNLYANEKDFNKAIPCYQKVLSIQPDFVEIHSNLGSIFQEQGKLAEAIACYRKVLELKPDSAETYVTLGYLLNKQNQPDEAMACYYKAIELKPDSVWALNNLGGIFQNRGKLTESISCYQKALLIKPDSFEVYCNLGLAFFAFGNFSEAIASYQKAVELNPDFADAYSNLGDVFCNQGDLDVAITCYRKALAIKPDLTKAHFGLGISLVAPQEIQEAVACFRRVLELEPDHLASRILLLHQLQHICEWGDLEANLKAVRRTVSEVSVSGSQFPLLAFLTFPGATAEEQKRCAVRSAQNEFAALVSLRKKLGFEFKRPANKRISIGYISADFRQHPVSFLMAEIFELHDRSRFHVSAYSYGPDDGSAMRKRLENAFDDFVDIRNNSFEDASKKIYADHIDILVDLTGHTQDSRSGILALRPAPVQVNYLGYPGTMGADFVDYLIADRFTIPPEKLQYYTEKVIWLPDCFQANDRTRPRPPPPNRMECGLPEEGVVFCCFNQTVKFTPEIFDVWCRLLRAVPGSILWLPASNPLAENNLRREADIRGVTADRLIMAPLLHRDEHLARLQCADLFLDTLPFNAGTTCSDALWMGLPVVTCAGDAFASRMAGSLLTSIGIPELITYNLEDYYNLALDLATDRKELDAIRSKVVANRDTAPLFDSGRFTRNLEQAYIQMVNEHS